MHDVLFFSKLRVLLCGWRWKSHRRASWLKARLRQWRRRARRLANVSRHVLSQPSVLGPQSSFSGSPSRLPLHTLRFTLEPMEQRLLLAADLTGVVQSAALIDPAVPTNTASAVVRVQNSGNANVAQSQIGVYASLDTVLDSSDLLLGTANTGSVAAGASKNVTVNLTVPNTLQPIDHTLLAKVDNANAIAENSETNNVAVGGTINGTWQFGTVPGRTGNTTLTLREADGTVVTFRLTGPGLGEVIKDGTTWDLNVTGTTASSAVTITTNSAGSGRVTLNDIHVLGTIGTLLAATTDLTGTLAIDGPVNIPGAAPGTVTLRSVQGGTVAMPSVEALTILGPTTNAKFYIGATLGQDGQPGGTGANADTYGPGKIGLFTVTGSMTNTTVRVGVDPVDGTYGNSNDQLIGGTSSAIDGIVIGGSLSADTRFYAGKFPTQYLNRTTLKPTAGDVHFVTLVSGSPTTLTAALQQDTGSFTSDGLTKDPTIVGTLTDLDGIATFTASFSTTPTFNVLSDRQSNGAFIFSRARLEEIARSEGIMNTGEPLPDGTYVLTLRAMDTGGNPTQISVPVTLDTAIPGLTLDLDPASDTAPLGDSETTNATVTLVGHTEGNASVELVGLGLTTTADASGQFGFTNVALTLGANALTVRAMDTAGNQRTETKTITRVQADSDGDGILDTDEGVGPNGGDANNDGIADSQQANVASLRNTVDNQYVTLVSPTGTQLTDVTAGAVAPGAPAGIEFPFGQIGFEVHGVTPGGSAEVTMLLPDGSGVNGFYKFGPEPGASPLNQPHWYDFNLNGGTGAAISGNTVTLNLKDGDRGDADLAANGVIVDPGGVAFTNHAPELAVIKKQAVVEEELLTFTASATDPDAGQTLTYSLGADAPAGMAINAETGVVTWTPTASDVGVYTLTVRVTDDGSGALSAEQAVTVRVMAEGVVEWAGVGAGSSWSDPLNWSTGEVPDATSDVVIRGATTVTLHNDNPEVNVSIKSLTMDAETTLRLGATAPWRFDVLEAAQGGTIELTGNVELQVQGATVLEHLTLVGGHAVFVGSATLGQLESGVFDPGDPHYTGPGGDGHLGDVEFLQAATIHDLAIGSGALAHGSALTLTGQGRVLGTVNANTLTIAAGASLDLVHQQGFGSLVNGGSVTLAAGIPLTLTGNYTQTGSGVLRIAVSEQNTVGTIAVGGTATLDGTLQVTASGTLPEPIELVLMTFGAKSGAFSTVTLPASGPEQTVKVDQTAGTELLLYVEGAADAIAPRLVPTLQQDSGGSASDGITTNPAIRGTLTDNQDIATFVAGFGATPTVDILDTRQADGSFTLSRARLSTIYGASLPDGEHTLTLLAIDAAGNQTQQAVPFTLDTDIATLTVNLDPASDTPPFGDHETTQATVTLVGQTEAHARVEVGQSVITADATGLFSFTPALALGANTFTVRATDAAGNERTTTITISRVALANQLPVLDLIRNQAVVAGRVLTFTAHATDPDAGQTLTYSLGADAPAGMAINAETGVVTWTPTASDVGVYTLTVRVTDDGSGALSAEQAVTVRVMAEGVVEWAGVGAGSSWSDPLNWSTGEVPDATSDVVIRGATTVTLHNDNPEVNVSIKSLTMDAETTLRLGATAPWRFDVLEAAQGGTIELTGNVELQVQGATVLEHLTLVGGHAVFVGSATLGQLESGVFDPGDPHYTGPGGDGHLGDVEFLQAATIHDLAIGSGALAHGSALTLTGQGRVLGTVNANTLTIAAGASLDLVHQQGFGSLVNGGSVTLAAGIPLTLTGNYTQTGSGVLRIAVSEQNTVGTIAVGGTATLDGTLQVTASGTLPEPIELVLMTFGAKSGAFSTVQLPTLPAGQTILFDATGETELLLALNTTPLNSAPVAMTDSYTTAEGTPLVITALGVLTNDTDANHDPLTAVLVSEPAHGNLTLNANGSFTYTPNADFNGTDSFTYKANDGTADSNIATVNLTMTAVNDTPVAVPDTLTVMEDTAETYTAAQLVGNDTDVDSSSLAIESVTNGTGGTVVLNSNETVTFTPTANFNGQASFSYTVTDGDLTSAPATVTVNVTAVNDGPVAQASTVTTNEDQAKTFAVTDFGFTDVEGDSLASITISSLTLASGDTLTLSGTDVTAGQTITAANIANLVYTPAANANGSARSTFAFTVNDAASGTEVATMTIDVTAVNQAPVAVSDTLTATEDTAETYPASQLVSNDTDGDADALTVASVTNGTGGTVVLNGNGTVTFTPTANFNGEANFSYTVTDGDLTSAPATVTVNVTPVNDAPSFTTGPDQAVQEDAGAITVPNWATSISAGPSDESGQQLTFVVTNDNNTLFSVQPTVAPDGTLTFASAPNVFGTATVTVMLRDDGGTANGGSDTSAAQTFSLTVTPVNDGPTVLNPIADVTVPEDAADTVIDLAGATPVFADVETAAGALTYSVTSSAPSVVAATVDNVSDKLTLAYPPNASGTATITVTASDGVLTVSDSFEVTVTAVNQAPAADAQTVTTTEDTAKTITLSGSDSDADSLTYTIVDGPQHGTLTGTGATRIYTPNTNYGGPDSFTFTVNDGTVDSNVATVTIDVTAVNDAPVLGPIGNRSVSEEDRLTFIVNASDPDGLTTLAFSLENGVGGEVPPGASIDALGTFTWTPTEVQGPGSYTFDVVATETGTPALAGRETITVAVSEVNRAPILQAISDQTITAGQQLAFTAVGIDFDLPANSPASTLTYSIDLSNLPPGYGTLNTPAIDPSTGVFTWTPAEGQVGAHVITVRVENELRDGLFAEQQVRFNVESANHAPVLNPIADRTINEGETLTFTAVATDPDVGQVLTFSLLDAPEGANIGTLSGVFSWIPTEAQGPGNYQVTLAVSDGVLTTSSTISITVSEVNQAPVANAQSVTTPEDSSKTITLTGSDGDGNPLTYTIVDGPTHGTLTGTGATRTYTPTANYNGPDSFTFRANDGTVDSVPAMVAITVTPVNDVPVADAQMVTTAEDTAKPITLTGSDVEDDPLTFSIVDSPQHGTLIGTDATRTYTPAPNFSGTDSFTFRINDGQMDSNVATVTIMVTPAVAGVRWINSAGGDWNVASNWSTGVVPTATDDVVVDLAGTYTITHSTGTTQIKSLKSEHQINLTGGTLEVAETVEMNGAILTLMGGTLKNATVNGTGVSGVVIQVVGDSTLHGVVLEGPIAMTVASSALLTIERGLTLNGDISSGTQAVVTIYGSMVMTGPTTEVQTINGTGGWIYLYGVGSRVSGTSGIHLEIGANIGIFSGSSGIIGSQDSTVTGLGYIQTTANGSLELIHFSNSSQGSYLDVFGSLSVSGLFTNSGRIEAHGGANLDFLDLNNEGDILVFSPGSAAQQTATINMMGANPLINRGTIQIWNGLTLALTGSLTNTFDGRILLRQADASYGDGHLAVTEDVTNEGQSIAVEDGSMTVGGNLNNQAALDLGTGLAHVTGDYIQSDTGTLSVVLGSTTNFGRLEIEGSATLSGHFRQVTGGSNTPTDRYQFMTFAGGRTGFFTTQDLILYAIDETDPNDLELFFVGL